MRLVLFAKTGMNVRKMILDVRLQSAEILLVLSSKLTFSVFLYHPCSKYFLAGVDVLMVSFYTMLTKNVWMPMNVLILKVMETVYVAVPSARIPLVHFHAYVPLDILTTITYKFVFNLLLVVEKLSAPLDVIPWGLLDLNANVLKVIRYT